MWETGSKHYLELFFMSPNQLINHHFSTAWSPSWFRYPIGVPMSFAELKRDPGQLGDEPAYPISHGSIRSDPAMLQPESIGSHPALPLWSKSTLWNEKVDVLDSRQGRHIETGERMPQMGFYYQTWMSFHPKDDIWQSQIMAWLHVFVNTNQGLILE